MTQPSRTAGVTALVAAFAMVLAACAPDDPDTDPEDPTTDEEATDDEAAPDPTDEELPDRDEIVIAVTADPIDLHPGNVGHNEVNTPAMRNVFEPLIERDADTGELLPGLATDWRQVDEVTWEFDLREGVVFHDGNPFDADAAAQALNLLYDLDLPEAERGQIGSVYGGPAASAEVVDEYVLRLETVEPDPILPSRMYFFMMFSPAAFDDPSQLADNPVGTGPYRFVEWERGAHVQLEAFDDWWGHDSPDARGSVSFQTATFLVRSEAPVRTSMIMADEADIVVNLSPEDCEELQGGGHECVTVGGSSTIFTQIDAFHPESMFTDLRLRQALTYAIDTEVLVEAILGDAVTASQMVASHVTGYNDELEPYPFDPDRSRDLIAEYQADGGELEPISYWYEEDRFPRVSEFATAVGAMLEDVGFEVQVSGQESGVASAQAWPPNFEPNRIRSHTHGNALGDLGQTASIYFREPPGGGDIGCWCQDDALFEMVREGEELVGDDRASHWEDVARHVYDQHLYHYGAHLAFNYGLSGDVLWEPPVDHFYRVIEMEPVG